LVTVNFDATNCISVGTNTWNGCSNFTTLNIGNIVTRIPTRGFQGVTTITSVSLPNRITTIGDYGFDGCSSLSIINLPNLVTSVGNYAFNGCSSLQSTAESQLLPENLVTIGNYAFQNASTLAYIHIPSTVTSIGKYAFKNCTALNTVDYEATNCTYSGTQAEPPFFYCSALANITVSDNVTQIPSYCFKDCSALTNLTLNNGLATIGTYGFFGCQNLGSLVIPASVDSIGSFAFGNEYDIQLGYVESKNPTPPVIGGAMAFPAGQTIYVPSVSLNNYEAAEYWNEYNLVGIETNYCEISATANPAEGGIITGTGIYEEGQICVLNATANNGYGFVNWTENGEEVSTEAIYSFTVTGGRALVANFVEVSNSYYWDVNIFNYANNMTMIGIIQINGEEQATNMLEIGAFCGEECRGREHLSDTYYPILGHYFVFLTVYGDDGNEISFRLYDHNLGDEFDLTCAPVSFTTNATFGNVVNPYVFNFVEPQTDITQVTNFAQGWNWWSTYVETEEIEALTILEEGLGMNGLTIKSQNGFVQYSPEYNIWYGSNGFSINNEPCYMIQTEAPCEVEITGSPANPADHPITLATGWNWIGYPCGTHMDFTSVFSGITPSDNDQVKSQSHGFASYLEAYNIWFGTLADYGIDPGMGLMYKSNNGSSFSFTYPNGRYGDEPTSTYFAEDNHWTADYNAYPNNMTVTAVVELDDVELNSDNYELAAFANDECRGSVRLMYVAPLNRYMAFLTVAGEEVADLNFGLYNTENGAVETVCTPSLQYETNAVVGSLETPYVIRFRSTTGVDDWADNLHVFPNPVARGEQFTLGLTANEIGKVQIEIINALGVVETWRAASVQTITAPDVAGVYTLRITVEGKGTCYRKLVVR